jgi:hypothetical protein
MGIRLLCRLPAHLRRPLVLDECRDIVRRRLARREDDFLDLMRRAVFENEGSPYGELFALAGCEHGDLERMVRREGLESALVSLLKAGVYLTTDEYKGRRPVVRGSKTIAVDPGRLLNPLAAPDLLSTTSGSRGIATRIPLNLDCIRDRAVNIYLSLDARGGARWRNAVWGMPGFGPLLWFSVCGGPAAKWFATLDPRTPGLHPRYRWGGRAIAWTGRLAGVPMPFLEYVPLDAPLPAVQWMSRTLRTGDVPHLWGTPSAVVRLCQVAEKAGIDLGGARFTVTGEPVTEPRLAAIRRVGADAAPDYGSVDSGGSVGYGCLSPDSADDVHVFTDLNVVIQADTAPFPKGALLLSSIRPTVPFIFLNVSMGDQATLSERRCGCPMEELGWRTHLCSIRSYEKLTAGGMTFADSEVVRILEEVLPARFGGGPTDYQLVEDASGEGLPRLRLLVEPSLPPADPAMISKVFLEALGLGSGTRQVMALQWRESGLLSVERRRPFATASGKILHLWARSTTPPGGSG